VPDKPTVFAPKGTQTEVKHLILKSCLRAWGGIIVQSNPDRVVSLSYVDTCCGSGLYERDPDDDKRDDQPFEVGSAIIGLTELAQFVESKGKAASVNAKALFINESAAEIETLKAAIKEHAPKSPPYTPKVGLFTEHIDEVIEFCTGRFSFVFIDPYGPTAVPFDAVSRVVQAARTDAIIHFPYYAVEKWTGWLESNKQPQRLARVDALMNGPKWRDVVAEAKKTGVPLEPRLLAHYVSQLASLGGVYTCSIPMRFPDRERTMYHLVFTTHNVAGFASAKEKFQKADHYQAYLKLQRKVGKKQGLLFSADELAPADPVDVHELARGIRDRFGKGTFVFEDIVGAELTAEHVLLSHVQKALRLLRREKAAQFEVLKWKTPISFL
jgi:three-Cys-motif partner protein